MVWVYTATALISALLMCEKIVRIVVIVPAQCGRGFARNDDVHDDNDKPPKRPNRCKPN